MYNIYYQRTATWTGQLSRYSDWLQAARSGDRIPVGGETFSTCPDRPWGPPSLLYNAYRSFPGGKERPGRDADPSPPSSAVVTKGQSYTSTPPMGRTACTEPQCLYKGELYPFFTLTATMVTRTHLTVMSHVHCLSRLRVYQPNKLTHQRTQGGESHSVSVIPSFVDRPNGISISLQPPCSQLTPTSPNQCRFQFRSHEGIPCVRILPSSKAVIPNLGYAYPPRVRTRTFRGMRQKLNNGGKRHTYTSQNL